MIIKQVFLLILYIYFILIYSYVILVPGLVLSNNYIITKVRELLKSLSTYIINNFDIDIYLSNNYKNINFNNDNLVNIIVCNHKSSIDFIILLTIFEILNIDQINFVVKKSINFIPGLGLIVYSNTDIKLDRKWETDQINLDKQLDKINNGYIIIYPEGTRYNNEKFISGNKYSEDNNLPIYNNLLVPKSKGLNYIINYLKNNNKLGKIYDFTLIFPEFLNESIYITDLLKKSIKSIYCNIRELQIDDLYLDQTSFKQYLLKEWKNKDDIITNYNNKDYEKMFLKYNNFNLKLILIICVIGLLILINKKRSIYLLISIILSYIIILRKK